MRERIEFDNPKSMDEVIRKARICYQQSKQKGETVNKKWNEKRGFKTIGNKSDMISYIHDIIRKFCEHLGSFSGIGMHLYAS